VPTSYGFQEGPIAEVWREPADPETALFLGYARVYRDEAVQTKARNAASSLVARVRRSAVEV